MRTKKTTSEPAREPVIFGFGPALERFREGFLLRRLYWPPGRWVELDEGFFYMGDGVPPTDKLKRNPWTPREEDILSFDWEIFEA